MADGGCYSDVSEEITYNHGYDLRLVPRAWELLLDSAGSSSTSIFQTRVPMAACQLLSQGLPGWLWGLSTSTSWYLLFHNLTSEGGALLPPYVVSFISGSRLPYTRRRAGPESMLTKD